MRKVGPVIDTLLALGITELTGPRFVATDTDDAREAALRDATKAAREQAEIMAQSSGMKLGALLSLNSAPGYGGAFEAYGPRGARAVQTSGGPPTSVVEPFVQIEVTVAGRWEVVSK
jgi:uncharacterized protein YggE